MSTALGPKKTPSLRIPQGTPPHLDLGSELVKFINHETPKTQDKPFSLFDSEEFWANWENFLDATQKASYELEEFTWRERARNQLWLYNKGQARGLFQGLLEGLLLLFPSRVRTSAKPGSLREISKELPLYGDIALDFGTEYMEADWEKKGEMAGKATVKTGLWILNLKNLWRNFKKILGKNF